jgi:hypothetical protein
MARPIDSLDLAKANRNAAHMAFHLRLDQVQEDLAARGVGGRIADRAGEAVSDAAEMASEHKAVIAGTLAALAVWFLRRPLVQWLASALSDEGEDSDENEDRVEQEKEQPR